MFYALLSAAFVALVLVALFVWTALRSAVQSLAANRRDQARQMTIQSYWNTRLHRLADVADDRDRPVDMWPTYTDPRAVDYRDDTSVTDVMFGSTDT